MAAQGSDEVEDGADVGKLRRFALGIATVLIVLVLGGGSLKDEINGSFVGVVKFAHPGVLLYLLALLSIYATVRYAYYGIIAPVTRSHAQSYLMKEGSMLCVKLTRAQYEQQLVHQISPLFREHIRLEGLCPPGFTPWNFIVFTDHNAKPETELVKHVLANRVDSYFPGIEPNEITLGELYHDEHIRAQVGPLRSRTKRNLLLERCDTYLPLLANGFALLLLIGWKAGLGTLVVRIYEGVGHPMSQIP